MASIKYFFGILAGGIAYWLGGVDNILICLIAMIVIDYLTGVLQAITTKTVDSNIGFRGIVKKVFILAIVALAFIIETATGGTVAIREIVIMFFIANEAISLLENAGKIGLPFPEKLTEILKQLKGGKE